MERIKGEINYLFPDELVEKLGEIISSTDDIDELVSLLKNCFSKQLSPIFFSIEILNIFKESRFMEMGKIMNEEIKCKLNEFFDREKLVGYVYNFNEKNSKFTLKYDYVGGDKYYDFNEIPYGHSDIVLSLVGYEIRLEYILRVSVLRMLCMINNIRDEMMKENSHKNIIEDVKQWLFNNSIRKFIKYKDLMEKGFIDLKDDDILTISKEIPEIKRNIGIELIR